MRHICRAIIEELMQIPNPSGRDLERAKIAICSKLQAKRIPKNSEIIAFLRRKEREKLLPLLKLKAVRAISGVSVIAVMTKPWPCPHGKCAYCPGGPPYGVPQSYTGHEPATMRGLQHDFDPYMQVKSRIDQLRAIGHAVDKVELIVMGGTFPAMPVDYQEFFVRGCLDAISGRTSRGLREAIENAENSPIRNIGITVETRPDKAKEEDIDRLLNMGVTRIELGVQNIYDDIYELVDRGHTVQDVVEATRIIRDSGLKCGYHMMPGLPGSNFTRDLMAFETIFSDPRFGPDMIKIYPCLVLKGTKTYDWWVEGKYRPYTTEEAVDLIVEVKKMIPPWVRIMRVQRDIPSRLISAGVKKSNLRQLVARRLKELGIRCRCIRCREVGHVKAKFGLEPKPENIKLIIRRYEASEGEEVFLSFEDIKEDILLGLLRLRKPSERAHRKEIVEKESVIVRELHVFGQLVKVGEEPREEEWQHRGFGRKLLKEAERIGKEEFDAKKILVTSGIGARPYYLKLGYKRDGPYVSKLL